MQRTRLIVLVILVSLTCFAGWTIEEEIVLGRDSGWGQLRLRGTVLREQGFQGYPDILLADGAYRFDPATDLLLHFDDLNEPAQPNYDLNPSGIVGESRIRVFGTGSWLFSGLMSRLELTPRPGALFFPGSDWRDFSIEFWLYPAETESDQDILAWEGVTLPGEWGPVPKNQYLKCSIGGNRVRWELTNIFRPHDAQPFTVELEAQRELLPRQWHHHLLTFDSATGLVEYLVDGRLENFRYANRQNREGDSVFLPFLGSAGRRRVAIGRGLSGFLDEFRISSVHRSSIPPAPYEGSKGEVLFAPQDIDFSRSRLVSIESTYSSPDDTDIFFYFQLNNSPFALYADDPDWIPFEPGAIFTPDTRGRYLHLMAALYPDGKERQSPVLSDLTITYEPDLPPPPPSGLRAEAGNASVRLSWNPIADPDLEGYKIYYGSSPGHYFGEESDQGPSPVDAGGVQEFVLSGLENGRLYYFSVVAYDASTTPYQTLFSSEVSARPRKPAPPLDEGGE